MSDRVTLATSTGLPFLALAFHVAMGLIGLVSGFIAITVRKGGKWHRRSGNVFVYAMIAMGITAAAIAVYEGAPTVVGGVLTAYLVFTAYTAVKPLPGDTRRIDVGLAMLAFTIAAAQFTYAFVAFGRPGHQMGGVPAGMMFFMGTIVLLAAIGDVRMIRAGRIQGARRLARHLWRMSFGLFIASGSFAAQLVKMKFIPDWMRSLTVILILSAAPIVVLLYWMWRIRLRQNLRGLMTAKPIEA